MKTAAGGLALAGSTRTVTASSRHIEVSNLRAPREADAGDSVRVEVRVDNTGDSRSTTRIDYRLDGRVLGTRQLTLESGERRRISFTATVPSQLDPGTYTHGVYVRGSSARVIAEIAVSTAGAALFSVSNFRGPARADPGETVTATATVRNRGSVSGSTRVEYRIGTQVVANASVSLAPDEGRTVTLRGRVPTLTPATYQQGVFLGSTNAGQTASITIGPTGGAFEVLRLQGPTEAQSGDEVSVRATIQNPTDAEDTGTFEYRINNRRIDSRQLTLAAGERTTIELGGTVPTLAAGTYTQGVFVAGTGNGLTTDLTILSPGPSITVVSLSAPSRAAVGDAVAARVTVRNTGQSRGSARIEYRVGGTRIAARDVSVSAGGTRSLTLEGTVPERTPGTYQQGVFVGGSNLGLTTALRIDEPQVAVFSVSQFRTTLAAEPGSDISVRATITNVGRETGETRIEYRIGEQRIASKRVELGPNRSTTVQFDVTVPGLASGVYLQGVFVEGTVRGQSTTLRVTEPTNIDISGLQAPPSATVGDSITVRATLRNRGSSPMTRTVEHRIGNRILSETDVQVAAGASRTVTFTGTIPELEPGTYRHGLFVDGTSVTTTLEVTARRQPEADVSIGSFRGPSSIAVGQEVSVEASVTNAGDASGTVTVEYRIGDRIVSGRQVTVEAGAERTVTLETTVPRIDPGTYQHGVFVGGTTQGRSREVTVSAGTPRFLVGNLRGPGTVTPGRTVTVRATVTNTGTADGSTEVQYRLDGEVLASQTVDLPDGESQEVTFEVTIPSVDPDTYRHGVFVSDTDRGQTTTLLVEREATPTATPTETATATPTETATPEDTTGVFGPGFGPAAGIAGLTGVAVIARLYSRHVGSRSTEDGPDAE